MTWVCSLICVLQTAASKTLWEFLEDVEGLLWIKYSVIQTDLHNSFESLAVCIESTDVLLCILIYRPHKTNSTTLTEQCDRIPILGDFNIYICCLNMSMVNELNNVLDSFDVIRHAKGPTHWICLSHGFNVECVHVIYMTRNKEYLMRYLPPSGPLVCEGPFLSIFETSILRGGAWRRKGWV